MKTIQTDYQNKQTMKLEFSLLSKTKTLLGVNMEIGAQLAIDKEDGSIEMQHAVNITIGFILFYFEISFAYGRSRPMGNMSDHDGMDSIVDKLRDLK